MGKKKRNQRRATQKGKKGKELGSALADQLAKVELEPADDPPAQKTRSPHSGGSRTSAHGHDDDAAWAAAMGVERGDETDDEWLDFVNQEVEPLSEPAPLPAGYTPATPERTPDTSSVDRTAEREWREGEARWEAERQAWEKEKVAWTQQRAALEEQASAWETQVEELRERLAQAESKVEQAESKVERAKQRSERFLQEREDARAERDSLLAEEPPRSLLELLQQRGVPSGREMEALHLLAEVAAPMILSALQAVAATGKSLLEKHLVLCCDHPDCIGEASSNTCARLEVSNAALCEICQGSDNRRAVLRVVRLCRETRRYRLVVVGGSPDAHAELQRLVPNGFDLKLVDGKDRRNKQQATDDLRYADLVVIWGPTILPHKVSELYTKQKEAFPNKMYVAHKRGVSSMAREVCDFLLSLQSTEASTR